MPPLPRARAKRTPNAGVIPCVHNVRAGVPTTVYPISEMEDWDTHWIQGANNCEPCLRPDDDCPSCEAGIRIRPEGYFAAFLVTKDGAGRSLTPVVIGVPDKSRLKFPAELVGTILSLTRTGQGKLVSESVGSIVLPAGTKKLFTVEQVMHYRWFKGTAGVKEPEIPAESLEQVIRAIDTSERGERARKQREADRGKVDEASVNDLTRLPVEELERRVAQTMLPTTAKLAEEELRRRGLRPQPEPVVEPAPKRQPLKLADLDIEVADEPLIPKLLNWDAMTPEFQQRLRANQARGRGGYPAPAPETREQFTDRQIAEAKLLGGKERVA